MLQQFHEHKLAVIDALKSLAALSREMGALQLGGRLEAELAHKLEVDRFHLVVVGEFNHGKTSFVNALLGERALPVGVTPTTAVVHHIEWGQKPEVTRVGRDGSSHPLGLDALEGFSARAKPGADVKYVEIKWPAEILADRIVLVDTPGVNDLSLTRAEITYGYIPRSDAVLFVLDAGQPVKESERQFLQEQLLGKNRDKIVFVVQKSDLWNAAERSEGLDYVRSRLGEVVDSPKVFAVSAQAFFDGKPDQSGLEDLTDHLTRFLALERGNILLENALGEARHASRVLQKALDARRRAQTMSTEKLAKRLELLAEDLAGQSDIVDKRRRMVSEECAAIKAWARRDLDRFCDEFLEKLPVMLENARGDDVKQHFAPYLERAFQQWANAETQEIATSLEQLAERAIAMVREDAEDVGRRVGRAMGSEVVAPPVDVDTFAGDISVFAMLSLGLGTVFANALLGGVLLVAAPALALYNKDRTDSLLRQRALELAPGVIRSVSAKVAPKIDEMVDDFRERLDNWIVAAGQELHQEVIEVLENVKSARADGEANPEAERASLERFEAELEKITDRFDALGQALEESRDLGASPEAHSASAGAGNGATES